MQERVKRVFASGCLTFKCAVPHAFGGVIVEVLQQLRNAQHGLKHHGQGTQRFHKHSGVQQQQGDKCTQHSEAKAEEQVVFKGAPLPEVSKVQIWGGGQIQRNKCNFRSVIVNTVVYSSQECEPCGRESKSDGASVCVVLEVRKVLSVCGDRYRGATVRGGEGRLEEIAGDFINRCIETLQSQHP